MISRAMFPDVRFTVRRATPRRRSWRRTPGGYPWMLEYPQQAQRHHGRRTIQGGSCGRSASWPARAFPSWSEQEIKRRVPYLPNYYPWDGVVSPASTDEDVVNVGCFGAARPFKNMVGQAIAALMFAERIGRPLNFHINGDRIEAGGGPNCESPGSDLRCGSKRQIGPA